MSVDVNAYARYSTNSSYTNPIVWSPESEKWMYEQAVFINLVKTDLRQLNQPGVQWNGTLNTAFSSGLLTEGVETPISAQSWDQITVNFYGYGGAVQTTDEEMATGFSYIVNDIASGAMGSMAEIRDSVIVTALMGTGSTGIYPNGRNSGTITTADTFNTDMISDVQAAMMQTQAKKCKAIVVHPNQYKAMTKLANFVNAGQYGDNTVIKSGEIGSYLGIAIFVSNHITSATENAITVYKAIAVSENPAVFMPKTRYKFVSEREKERDRAIVWSWYEMFGVARIRDDFTVVLTSA